MRSRCSRRSWALWTSTTPSRPSVPTNRQLDPSRRTRSLPDEVTKGWRRKDLVEAFITLPFAGSVTGMITELKRIVLAEDNPNDVELTLAALSEINLANEVVLVRDGAEALDYLFRRNQYRQPRSR